VTSAETVLLNNQGLDEFLSNINEGKTVIVSVSPQSRASIAAHFRISPLQVTLWSCSLINFFYTFSYMLLRLNFSGSARFSNF